MSENPFKFRICEVFSSSGSGMTFLDFLDMCSVFSEGQSVIAYTDCTQLSFSTTCVHLLSINIIMAAAGAPWDLKAAYAFRVYDFNTDAHLCASDLEEMLICITGTKCTIAYGSTGRYQLIVIPAQIYRFFR